MNKARRKEIAEANDLISKAISILSDARSQLEQRSADEQEYFDEMPESLQGGDKGTHAEECVSQLDEFVSTIEELESQMENLVEEISSYEF